jgi:uncharacterized protein YggU (UPF0235/DUF167 family)
VAAAVARAGKAGPQAPALLKPGLQAAGAQRPWGLAPGGLALAVRVTPKGGRDAIEGIAALADGTSVLKVRVRAAASEGEANAALLRLLAGALAVPVRAVRLEAGGRGRVKRLRIGGDGAALAAALERICGGAAS